MTRNSSVLIIGAVSDIGRAVAHAYAATGRTLVLAARAPERLEADAVDLRLRYGVDVRCEALDILEQAAHGAFITALGPLPGTVVCVVGLLGDQKTSSSDLDAARLVMLTNYVAPALFMEAIAGAMAARGSGTMIGISSVAGDRGRGSNYTYGSAKAGFTAFLSGLRNRLAPTGVHVITVKPGFVATKMTEGMKLNPKLTAQPHEVAAAILQAEQKGRNVIYVRPIWRVIMAIIRAIPEPIFKKLKL